MLKKLLKTGDFWAGITLLCLYGGLISGLAVIFITSGFTNVSTGKLIITGVMVMALLLCTMGGIVNVMREAFHAGWEEAGLKQAEKRKS